LEIVRPDAIERKPPVCHNSVSAGKTIEVVPALAD
jgi:hypothetical protein